MNTLSALLTNAADLLLAPLAGTPLLALLLWSAVAGALAALVFRQTSNQQALRRAAGRTRASLMCLRLFKDDLRVALRAQAELIGATCMRLAHSLPPMLVLVVPFVLVLTQLALRYEHRPLQSGEAALVELHISDDDWPAWRDVQPQAPEGVRLETPALRDEAEHALYWRLRLESLPVEPLRWTVGEVTVEKPLTGAAPDAPLKAVNATRAGANLWQRVMHPGEPAFDAESPVQGVVVEYPHRSTSILGVNLPWWATFLIASMLSAVLMRPVLKVQF